MGPTFGGDPDDTGVAPFPLTLLGVVTVFLSVAVGGGLLVAGRLVSGDAGFTAAGFWFGAGGVVFGLGLVAWDRLTDFFESTRPGEDFEPGDEGLGAEVDGSISLAEDGDEEP